MIIPYLRTQSELLEGVRRRMRDPSGARWPDTEVYTAINECMLDWHGRVSIPHVYTISGGWVSGQTEYALPSYIRGAVDPQQRRYASTWLHVSGVASDADTWLDMQGFDIEPDGDGGQVIRFSYSPSSDEGRVIWWNPNGAVPLSIPTLNASIVAGDTSLVIASVVTDIEPAGYAKIETEWIHYAGVTEGASTTTLAGLTRGVNGTTAASHNSSTNVEWGVGAHRDDLFGQMYNYVRSHLHGLYLTDAAESERAQHERLSLYYKQLADEYWRRYMPARKPKIRLDSRGTGPLMADAQYHHYTRSWGSQL